MTTIARPARSSRPGPTAQLPARCPHPRRAASRSRRGGDIPESAQQQCTGTRWVLFNTWNTSWITGI